MTDRDHARSSPVFVVGYMHSGTTLMYRILGHNQALFSGDGETKFFEFLPALRARYADLAQPEVLRQVVVYTLADLLNGFSLEWLRDAARLPDLEQQHGITTAEIDQLCARVAGVRDHADVFRIVFEHLAARASKPRWLEKTPTHVFHIDDILRAVPDARFVEITRDPRDVLASKKTRRADVWTSDRYRDDQRERKHYEKAYDPFWDALSWKSAIRAGQHARAKYPDRVYHVAYEDLVANPEATVRGFCEFLSLTYDPQMLAVSLDTAADRKGREQRTGIYSQSVGRWASTLDEGEIALAQLLLRPELEALGYAAMPVRALAHAKAVERALASQSHLAVRLYRRWKLGGPQFLRNVVLGYGRRLRVLVGG